MPNLQNLSLASNQIQFVSKNAFDHLPKLKELILRGNYLKSNELNVRGLPNLIKLDLSHNLLQLIRQVKLFFRQNLTKYFDEKIFERKKHLTAINSHN